MNKTVRTMNRRSMVAHCSRFAVLGLVGLVGLAPGGVIAQGKSSTSAPPVKPVVLVVGDSLSAEYGLSRGAGWVALLEQRLAKEKVAARVVNASISGDTSSGGRSRLPALLKQHQPSLVIVELGGNDALRGLPMDMTRDNLTAMTRAAQASGATVVLAGMQVPPNYGRTYGDSFIKVFGDVATQEKAVLIPFLLKGIGDVKDSEKFFQSDRIHPNESAHPVILANVWPVVMPLLNAIARRLAR